MNQFNRILTEDQEQQKLPRRDWILLPLFSFLTVFLITGSTELVARRIFRATTIGKPDVVKSTTDPLKPPRQKPNAVFWGKEPESSLIQYRINSCGHRTDLECGPKAPGTYRIVMVGTSAASGFMVPVERTVATLLPPELSLRTMRKIELYNAAGWQLPHNLAADFDEVAAAHPDLILWVLTNHDVAFGALVPPDAQFAKYETRGFLGNAVNRLRAVGLSKFLASFPELFGYSKTALMLRHLLYQSQSRYVQSYLTIRSFRAWLSIALNSHQPWRNLH